MKYKSRYEKLVPSSRTEQQQTPILLRLKEVAASCFEDSKGLKLQLSLAQDNLKQNKKLLKYKRIKLKVKECRLKGLKVEDFQVVAIGGWLDLSAALNSDSGAHLLSEKSKIFCGSREAAYISGKISREALEEHYSRSVKDFKIEFVANKFVATGKYELMGKYQEIEIRGSFELVERQRINLKVDELKLKDVRLHKLFIRLITNQLNPLVDFSRLPFSPTANTIKIEGEYVVVQ